MIIGDPTEEALLVAACKGGIDLVAVGAEKWLRLHWQQQRGHTRKTREGTLRIVG